MEMKLYSFENFLNSIITTTCVGLHPFTVICVTVNVIGETGTIQVNEDDGTTPPIELRLEQPVSYPVTVKVTARNITAIGML